MRTDVCWRIHAPQQKRIGRVSRGGEPLVLAACAVVTSDMNRYYTGVAGLAKKSRYCSEGVAVSILHENKMRSRSCSLYWPNGVGVLDPSKISGLYPPMYCSEEVAVLRPHEDRLKLRPYPIYWPEEVAVSIPDCKRFRLLCTSMYCSFNIMARRGCSFDRVKYQQTMATPVWPTYGTGFFDPSWNFELNSC